MTFSLQNGTIFFLCSILHSIEEKVFQTIYQGVGIFYIFFKTNRGGIVDSKIEEDLFD